MAWNVSPVFEKAPFNDAVSYANADGSPTKKTLVASGDVPTEGMRIDTISIVSTDTSAREIRFYLNDGSTDFAIGSVSVPVGAGTGSTLVVDAIDYLAPTIGYVIIPTAWSMKTENQTTITAAKTIDICARGGSLTA